MKNDSVFEVVRQVTELPGPIGQEQPVQQWAKLRWENWCETVGIDRVGNLLAFVGGQGPRVIVDAHSDEICFMVRSISEEGFLFLSVHNCQQTSHLYRGLFPIGQPALILGENGPIEGVFASPTGHVLGTRQWRETDQPLGWNDFFVDAGVDSAEDLTVQGVHPGCRVIWNPKTWRSEAGYICGKAMDNRVGVAILTLLGETLVADELAYEVHFASTAQEEIGMVGATSVGLSGHFDVTIVLDVGLCGDVPQVDPRDVPTRLRGGPILVYQDSAVHYDPLLAGWLANLAQTHEIPFQRAVFQRYASDGEWFIRRGIPSALLAFPARYTHSPFEMVHEDDLQHCVSLLNAFLTTPPPDWMEARAC